MDSWGPDDRAAMVALLRIAHSAAVRMRFTQRADEAGSARTVLREELGQPTFMEDPVESALADARARILEWEAAGITVLAFGDPEYPVRLRGVHDMPGVLFCLGATRAEDHGVAVVGSRRASDAGLRQAHELARCLAQRGVTVVSGLAAGVDTAAHGGALSVNGRTVGVLGTGLAHVYPPENRGLHREVAEAGALLSQFWPDTPPDRHTFPSRNATMSGYALATVVVEAGEKSGARIQARQAIEHGRPVVLMRQVRENTAWGRQFAGRPDVHVADDVDTALSVLEEVEHRPDRIHTLLSSLSSRSRP